MEEIEIVKNFDSTYYCNLKGINEYISLKQLKEEVKAKYGITIKSMNKLKKYHVNRKTYFYQLLESV
jgi:hypothetical protein